MRLRVEYCSTTVLYVCAQTSTALSFFLFSYQVHEKSILLAALYAYAYACIIFLFYAAGLNASFNLTVIQPFLYFVYG